MTEPLKGMDDLVRNLTNIKNVVGKKAAKAGIQAGMTVLMKGIRNGAGSSRASEDVKAAARKTVGKKLKKIQSDYIGKIGFGIGAGGKKAAVTKAMARHGEKGGVGLSGRNIHWFALGTKTRKQATTGRATGSVSNVLAGIVSSAAKSTSSEMLAAAGDKVKKVLAADAAKSKKG
jgi:hypothetical protein